MSENMNVTLTLAERDMIDTAKGRIRRFSALLRVVVANRESEAGMGDDEQDDDIVCGIESLIDFIHSDAEILDRVFQAADQRTTSKAKGA